MVSAQRILEWFYASTNRSMPSLFHTDELSMVILMPCYRTEGCTDQYRSHTNEGVLSSAHLGPSVCWVLVIGREAYILGYGTCTVDVVPVEDLVRVLVSPPNCHHALVCADFVRERPVIQESARGLIVQASVPDDGTGGHSANQGEERGSGQHVADNEWTHKLSLCRLKRMTVRCTLRVMQRARIFLFAGKESLSTSSAAADVVQCHRRSLITKHWRRTVAPEHCSQHC